MVGLNLEFEIITVVVVGGTGLIGDWNIYRNYNGCIMMSVITTGLGMMNISISFNYPLKGILILAEVYFDIAASKERVKREKDSSKGDKKTWLKTVNMRNGVRI